MTSTATALHLQFHLHKTMNVAAAAAVATATYYNACCPLTSFQCLVNHGYRQFYDDDTTYLVDIMPVAFTNAPHHQDQTNEAFEMVEYMMQQYWLPKDGFHSSKLSNADDKTWTYGEVTSLGCRQLAYAMNIIAHDHDSNNNNNNKNNNGNDVVFVDLGSGMGRLVTQL
jgi:hypothetical protein